MKIYTKTGDDGSTGLFGGPRVSKDHARICAYGEIDELNSLLGIIRAHKIPDEVEQILSSIQHTLFSIGAELATPNPESFSLKWKAGPWVQQLEDEIDRYESALPPLKNFILPGGTPGASYLHLARTTCRRAERAVVSLSRDPEVSDLNDILVFLNRLSDYLFVASRLCNLRENKSDVPWISPRVASGEPS